MTTEVELNAKTLAVKFHQEYERLAPSFGYETRPETKQFDETSPNGKLMIAVCEEILSFIYFPDGTCFHGILLENECEQCHKESSEHRKELTP